jgi:uncharacterized radical SAM superfamily protein
VKLIDIIETDFVNYKVPCMTVMFPYCSFKCNKECNKQVCHNTLLQDSELVELDIDEIVQDYYLPNIVTEAIVMQGLEPFDSFNDLKELVKEFSEWCNDDIVIYTGYKEEEIKDEVKQLCDVVTGNDLIIKFGRFIPNIDARYDSTLGVVLRSDNQYAKVVKSSKE